jgi:ABC-2 type transport system permease protein
VKTLALLVRREFWEHRAFVIAPAIVAAIMIVGAIAGSNDFVQVSHDIPADTEWMKHRSAIVAGLLGLFAVPYAIVMGIVITFYLLDSLYADRKDRSVLFWKSLPLSDTTTVLSKLLTATVVLPLLTFGAVVVTNLLVAFISSVRLTGVEHLDVWSTVWNPIIWLRVHGVMLYALLACALWYLPIVAWLLLASAWARRGVLLWAALPPILAMIVEQVVLDTNYVQRLLAERFGGWLWYSFNPEARHAIAVDGDRMPWPDRIGDLIDPVSYFTSPGLWGGLIVAGLLLWAAIIVRRRRSEV